jgi:hypothetical protein
MVDVQPHYFSGAIGSVGNYRSPAARLHVDSTGHPRGLRLDVHDLTEHLRAVDMNIPSAWQRPCSTPSVRHAVLQPPGQPRDIEAFSYLIRWPTPLIRKMEREITMDRRAS